MTIVEDIMHIKFYIEFAKHTLPSMMMSMIGVMFVRLLINEAAYDDSSFPIERPKCAAFNALQSFEPSPTKAT